MTTTLHPGTALGLGTARLQRPWTLPLDHRVLKHRVGFRSPRLIAAAWWVASRLRLVDWLEYEDFRYTAIAYHVRGRWVVTRVDWRAP